MALNEHKGKELHSISGSLKVQNFAVPVVSEERRVLYERVAMQRRLEMREIGNLIGQTPGLV